MNESERNSVNWGMVCHLSALALYIGIPFGNVLGPLVIWFLKKDSDPTVNEQGREILNFNLSFSVYMLLAGLLIFIFIGYVVLPLVVVTHVILVIRATLMANKGAPVQYPMTLRFFN